MSFAIAALVGGGLLGMICFGGLWLTIRRACAAANPVRWFAGSLLVRMSLVLVGFYMIAAAGWHALALGLLGFLLCRMSATRLARRALENQRAP